MIKAAAGITLYNPEIERLKENIESVGAQVDIVYLIDNASRNIDEIRLLLAEFTNVRLVENTHNYGIAYALNQLCAMARDDGYGWILLLDQDSIVETQMVSKYSRYTEMDKVAVITPYFDDEYEADIIKSKIEIAYEQVHRCNTSGTFTNIAVWDEIGGFDEKMFIDCVDFDYCTSLEEAGYVIIRDNEAVIHHRMGQAKEIRFFMGIGRLFNIKKLKSPVYTYNHPPLRTYYYARNIKYYTYKHRNFIDKKTERRVYLKWIVLKLCFEDQKFEKLKAIIRGRKDAGKMIKVLKEQGK